MGGHMGPPLQRRAITGFPEQGVPWLFGHAPIEMGGTKRPGRWSNPDLTAQTRLPKWQSLAANPESSLAVCGMATVYRRLGGEPPEIRDSANAVQTSDPAGRADWRCP